LQRIIFITGTDTGVGKTVLTALLISHLRQNGSPALALKPFCSGGRGDAELLHALQNRDLSLDEINPFHFSEPLAPLAAARKHNQRISANTVLNHVKSVARCLASREFRIRSSKFSHPFIPPPSTLLIEGAGGLLSPLGEPNSHPQFKVQSSNYYTALDLIDALKCDIILVAPNRLGLINHTLLAIRALQSHNLRSTKVVLIDILPPQHSTLDTRSNPSILTELLFPISLFSIPYLTKNPGKTEQIQKFAKKLKKTLAQILA